MHELGIVYEVIRIVDGFVKENHIHEVDKIVLEIGQLSQAIPQFIEACYPAAVADGPYQDTKLEIVQIEAIGTCKACDNPFPIVTHRNACPRCGAMAYRLICGEEFRLKEIVAR